jgi:ribosome silencing factor RsfS/YbeB/iojap
MPPPPPRSAQPLSLECPTIARKPPAPPSPPDDPPVAEPRAAVGPRRRAPARAGAAPKLPAPPGTPRKKAAAAGPAKARAPAKRERGPQDRLDQLTKLIVASLEDDKAENVVTLDLAGRAAFADRMVIGTGIADRQIAAMAAHLEEKLRQAGLRRIQIEGASGTDWVLIDAGDIVIHLFKPDARSLYGLEKMWGAELDEEPATAV